MLTTEGPAFRLATALAIGLLMGAERERRKGEGPQRSPAGIRTFAVAALLGGVGYRLGGEVLLAVTTLALAGFCAVAYWRGHDKDPGLTSETALMLAALLGGLAQREIAIASGIAVVVTILLAARTPLHHFVRSVLSQQELTDALWERPTIWRMLHNPAYAGHAFYGKTELRPRRRITRRLRQRGLCSRDSSFRERPRQEWIEIPVPALVSEATFALAQQQFEKNKRFSPRRTIEPSLLQGLLVCQRCGYGLYRASTRTSQRTIYYYRCLGRDGYRHLKGAVCDNQPIRQEQLDAVVWQEIVRLLEDPSLLQAELDRRLQAAQTTDPLKRREDALRRDQARLTKSMERLLTGYQENLITLEELRCRMPELRKQQRANEAELQSLEMTAVDPTRNLRLVETLAEFRTRLRARGNVLEVAERQRVVRLLVQEILVGRDNITIRHSIPMPASSPDSNHGVRPSHEPPEPNTGPSYLLRSNSLHTRDNVTETRRFGTGRAQTRASQ